MFKLAFLQIVCTVFFAAVIWYCFDAHEAVSALLGGLISVLSSFYIGLRMITQNRLAETTAIEPEHSLMRFYTSTIVKIVFTLMMMGICIIVLKVSILPFIIAYLLAAVIVNLVALRFIQ